MSQNTGQIKLSQSFGQSIAAYAADTRFHRYLEIGTWNGRGSTLCFYAGFQIRSDSPTLDSYEICLPRIQEARDVWKFVPNIRIHHAHIFSHIPDYDTICTIHPNMNETWYNDDVYNLKSASFLTPDSPEVVLLDGSEYFTYFEFHILKDIPSIRVFLLDDTSANKNKNLKVFEILNSDPKWLLKGNSMTERNGWAIFEKIEG